MAEIIVVDDGSTDGTELDYQEFQEKEPRLRVIRHPRNLGKTQALRTGVEACCSPLILFLDADLLGLKPENIRELIRPVQQGQADMTIGVFRGGRWNTDFSQMLFPWLGGQRCMARSRFFETPLNGISGYGIETAFTITAHRRGWHVQNVPLQGVYQHSVESRRGFPKGIKTKIDMYIHIVRTCLTMREKKPAHSGLTSLLRVLAVLVVVLVGVSLMYNRSWAEAIIQPRYLPLINVDGASRILVVAPRPGDEILGAGGLIQAALQDQIQVRVLVITNGDDQPQPASDGTLGSLPAPRPEDYIRAGEARHQETLNGLRILGLPSDRVDFLGYPNRQLSQLWLVDWKRQCPLLDELTETTTVPYPWAYHPGAAFCGDTLVESVRQILGDYRPDLIFLPQVNDDQPDHRAASQFVLMSLAGLIAQDPSYQPQIWGYIINNSDHPELRGWHLNSSLVPPLPLISTVQLWSRLDLTASQEVRKAKAFRAHPGQLGLIDSFLESFAHQDEVFERIELMEFADQLLDTYNLQHFTAAANPNESQPAAETTARILPPGAELIDLRLTNLGHTIQLTAETRAALLPEVNYAIQFKLEDGSTKNCTLGQEGLYQSRVEFSCLLDMSNFSRPAVFGFNVFTSRAETLDRTGWQFIVLR